VLTRVTKKKLIIRSIKEFQPDLICFTSVTSEYNFISKIAKLIKIEYPSIYLLIGGIYSSLNANNAIKGSFNAVCIGEGEYPTLELVKQLEAGKKPSKIQNLWIKTENKVEKNSTRDFYQDLDSFPFPDRDMWEKWIFNKNTGSQNLLISRGCPFKCSYCYNHAWKKVSSGNYVRFRSVGNILKEIKELIKKYPYTKDIYFEGDNIGSNFEFIMDLCSGLEKISQKSKLTFGVNLRIVPNRKYDELFRALKKANFRVNIGLESGSNRIRKKVLRRNYSNGDVIKAVMLAKKYGISVKTFNMVGLPGETLADFKKTVLVNRICLPNSLFINVFCPYPGTDIYKMSKKMNLLPDKLDPSREFCRPNLVLEEFSKQKIQREFQWFFYNVYRGFKPIHLLIGSVLIYKTVSSPLLFRIYHNLDNYVLLREIKSIFSRLLHFR
jgi:radical SAM superfamily enzyme YgiQ (UPF0313 family)